MPVGFETYDTSGRLQVSGDFINYVLHSTGTSTTIAPVSGSGWTAQASALIPIGNSSANRIVAIQIKQYKAAFRGSYIANSTTYYNFITDSPAGVSFKYFIYDLASTVPATNFGVEIRNANNEVTYNTSARVMQCVGLVNYGLTGNEDYSGYPSYYGQDPQSISVPGRDLAFAPMGSSGHSYITGYWCQDGGQMEIIADGPVNNCNDVRGNQDAKLYGGGTNAAGDLLSVGGVSFEDLNGVMLSKDAQNNVKTFYWATPLKAMVLDVTGVTGGVTVPPTGGKTVTISGSQEPNYEFTSTSKTFQQRNVTVSGGTAATYYWYIYDATPGVSWFWESGGGTNQTFAVPKVSGVAAGQTVTAKVRCDVVFTDNSQLSSNIFNLSFKNTNVAGVFTAELQPGGQSPRTQSSQYFFPQQTVSTVNGTPSSITWSIIGNDGSWSFSSGGGANQTYATLQVSGVGAQTTKTVTLRAACVYNGQTYNADASHSLTNITPGTTLISQASDAKSGASGSSTTSPFVLFGAGTTAGSPSYSWTIENATAGTTWGTYPTTGLQTTPECANVPAGTTATATLRVTGTYLDGLTTSTTASLSWQNTTSTGGGGGGYSASVTDQTDGSISAQRSNGPATATYTVHNDGTIKRTLTIFNGSTNTTTLETWRLSAASTDYEVMFSNFSGLTGVSGTRDTWMNLGTTRQMSITAATVNAYRTTQFTVSIRAVSTGVVLDTATIYMEASYGSLN